MLFNSFEFCLFLPLCFLLYWFVFNKNLKIQNGFILLISYIFYGWWDWRFLFLIFFSSSLDFYLGKRIFQEKHESRQKLLLCISVFFNLGLLVVFKYFNFFITSFIDLFNLIGLSVNTYSINIILPVGISFYTFQTLSYTIDIYKKKLKPTNDLVSFFAFVSFFPQLVAGPIERAQKLLPQFSIERKFNLSVASDGIRQILWGFFKKMVIADNCAIYVNQVFGSNEVYDGSVLFLGGVVFAIQVYADFSGYSDIAIGIAKLFGFNLTINFRTPYFSTHWGEFWKRWHITLSSWILDYIYTPIVLSKRHLGKWGITLALMITFMLNGLWHGANWTYVIFGFVLGLYISIEFLLTKQRKKIKRRIGVKFYKVLGWAIIMFSWVAACILFRCVNISHAVSYFSGIFNYSFFSMPSYLLSKPMLLIISIFFIFEWFQKNKDHTFDLSNFPMTFRWMSYLLIFFLILSFGQFNYDEFIYFQF